MLHVITTILIPIHSEWMCKILNGDKLIEVRRGLVLYNVLKKAERYGVEVEFLAYVTKAKPYLDYIEDDCLSENYQLDYDKLIHKPNMDDDELSYNDMVLWMREARKDGSLYSEHYYNLNGKVVARFKAKAEVIEQMEDNVFEPNNYQTETLSMQELLHESRLEYKQLDAYLQGKQGTALHIEDLEIFDEPKTLADYGLKRAPESWCYANAKEGK